MITLHFSFFLVQKLCYCQVVKLAWPHGVYYGVSRFLLVGFGDVYVQVFLKFVLLSAVVSLNT